MNGSGRITQHLFMNRQVDGITNGQISHVRLCTQCFNVLLNSGHLLGGNGTGIHIFGPGWSGASIVIRIRSIREFQLFRQFHRWHWALFGKVNGLLHFG